VVEHVEHSDRCVREKQTVQEEAGGALGAVHNTQRNRFVMVEHVASKAYRNSRGCLR